MATSRMKNPSFTKPFAGLLVNSTNPSSAAGPDLGTNHFELEWLVPRLGLQYLMD